MNLLALAAGAGLPAGLALLLTEVCRRVALRLGLTDRPAPHKAHRAATPYLGGVALVLGCLLPAAVLVRAWSPRFVVVVVAGVLVAGLGLVDDVVSLSVRIRLAVEVLAATAVALTTRPLTVSGVPWLDTAITVAWIVVITNSFNLLDNMDGAAASIGTATAGVLGIVAAPGPLAVLLMALAGGCFGFLAHNRPPARIFMGDAGSLFIGFVLASAVLLGLPPGRTNAYAVLLLATFVATVDTAVVLIDRRRRGRRWYHGGTDHVSHRLHGLGLSAGRVAAILFAGAAASTALGTLVAAQAIPGWPVLAAALLGATGLVWLLLTVPVLERA